MNGYAGNRKQGIEGEQVFLREFVLPEGDLLGYGELVKRGNRYFAVIGHGTYVTSLKEHPGGRGWVVDPRVGTKES